MANMPVDPANQGRARIRQSWRQFGTIENHDPKSIVVTENLICRRGPPKTYEIMNSDETESLTIVVPGRLPSWNQLLSMTHWGRHRYKKQTKAAFEFAYAQSEKGFSTKTISLKSFWWTSYATPHLSLTIVPKPAKSKSTKDFATPENLNT